MLGVILEAGGVKLCEGQQVYHRLSWVSPTLKPGPVQWYGVMKYFSFGVLPAIESSPESNILWWYVGSEDIISTALIKQRVDKLISRVGQEPPKGVSLLTQL